MKFSDKKWPGISIYEEDRNLIQSIAQQAGPLRGIDAKDALMIAAALAAKAKAPEVAPSKDRRVDTISPGNLNTYTEYKQFIALIYYMTNGGENLNNMNDPKVLTENFVDYARRGLKMLKTNYLSSIDGAKKLEEQFAELLATATKKS
ncbi:MAG TPA: hypothetical protein PLO25_00750 [Candidatus Saccharibacteria bacterium]|nr:hypothetical protein [Candidatus Saccharibacteria bacterium]